MNHSVQMGINSITNYIILFNGNTYKDKKIFLTTICELAI